MKSLKLITFFGLIFVGKTSKWYIGKFQISPKLEKFSPPTLNIKFSETKNVLNLMQQNDFKATIIKCFPNVFGTTKVFLILQFLGHNNRHS